MHAPARACDFERWKTKASRFIFDENVSKAEFFGYVGKTVELSVAVVWELAMKSFNGWVFGGLVVL